MMSLPGWRDWLFSARTFVAAMLALYAAMALALPRPYWAMATVYVVSNPLIGATRSKGLYRAAGTLLGAGMAVCLVPLLVDAPVLLSLAIALWAGILLYVSMLDRSPRGYLCMLAAYTLPMVALPAVSAPDQVFDLALARSEEILLGIACASLVAAVVWPGKVAPVLGARVDQWLRDAAQWAAGVLDADAAVSSGPRQHRLAMDILALDQLISQLAHDADSAPLVRDAQALRWRLNMLLPQLSALGAALSGLRAQAHGIRPDVQQAVQATVDWMQQGGALPVLFSEEASGEVPQWETLLVQQARARLLSLQALWQDCLNLRQRLREPIASQAAWQALYSRWESGGQARHHDHTMLLWAAGMAVLAIWVLCGLWIGLGWEDGGSAVSMGAVAVCFFAAQDEPHHAQRTFLIWNVVCVILAMVMMFAIIPAAHEFETLVLLLAVPFLCIGTLATKPQFTIVAMTLTVSTASIMGLSGAYSADFVSFSNGSLATVLGMFFVLIWTRLTRPFGAELALRRVWRATWSDLSRMAAGEHQGDYAQLTSRMFDRLSLTASRLVGRPDANVPDGLEALRVGFCALDLQRDEHRLAEPAAQAIHAVLQQVSQLCQARLQAPDASVSREPLGRAIDAALQLVWREPHAAAPQALRALTDLRLSLCPQRSGEIEPQGACA